MLPAVVLGHGVALVAHMRLKSGIDYQLFGDRVARQLPSELVSKALLVIGVIGVDDFVVVLLELSVVFGDDFGDGCAGLDGC